MFFPDKIGHDHGLRFDRKYSEKFVDIIFLYIFEISHLSSWRIIDSLTGLYLQAYLPLAARSLRVFQQPKL